jgi:hypothetical protein
MAPGHVFNTIELCDWLCGERNYLKARSRKADVDQNPTNGLASEVGRLRWPRLFEQKIRVVKWIVGRG